MLLNVMPRVSYLLVTITTGRFSALSGSVNLQLRFLTPLSVVSVFCVAPPTVLPLAVLHIHVLTQKPNLAASAINLHIEASHNHDIVRYPSWYPFLSCYTILGSCRSSRSRFFYLVSFLNFFSLNLFRYIPHLFLSLSLSSPTIWIHFLGAAYLFAPAWGPQTRLIWWCSMSVCMSSMDAIYAMYIRCTFRAMVQVSIRYLAYLVSARA